MQDEESEQDEVDGTKNGADSTGKMENSELSVQCLNGCVLGYRLAQCTLAFCWKTVSCFS